MIIGVAFYSYAIGNVTNYVQGLDSAREELNEKLDVLRQYKNRNRLNLGLYQKIIRHLENNLK